MVDVSHPKFCDGKALLHAIGRKEYATFPTVFQNDRGRILSVERFGFFKGAAAVNNRPTVSKTYGRNRAVIHILFGVDKSRQYRKN